MRLIGNWSDDGINILLDQFGNNICIDTYDQTALDPKKNKITVIAIKQLAIRYH